MSGVSKLLQRKVLQALKGEADYISFLSIETRTGLKRKELSRLIRHLARKGWIERANGRWFEDGEPFNCGYALTQLGAAQLAEEKP